MARVRSKKFLSQNFLIDENIARNIIRDLRLSPDDIVVEIGPGHGALTKYLAQHVRRLIAVEVDPQIVSELNMRFSSPKTDILLQDFLELDLAALHQSLDQRLRLVGNIPYHLTSDILVKAFDERRALQDFTLMVQREVAQRLAARPGTKEYGILSVYASFYGRLKVLFSVSPNCFFPKPKVSSAVIQEQFFERMPFDVDEQMFRLVVRTTFGKRRKTLKNSLKYLPFDDDIIAAIRHTPLLEKRPEQLSVEEFVKLTNLITQQIPSHSVQQRTHVPTSA